MRNLVTHIGTLHQVEASPSGECRRGPAMALVPSLKDAWLLVEDGIISGYGKMDQVPGSLSATRDWDARGGDVIPCWCDSHTHLVYAGSREGEFMERVRGMSYEQIAQAGGGILSSVKSLKQASEEMLLEASLPRLEEIAGQGTGAVEIKSGYGLSLDGELKMLRVIRKLKERSAITIRSTLLAAHALPESFRNNREGYLGMILGELIPRVADEGLADYIDVFCERGFFTVGEAETLMEAGWRHGLRPKIHANQLSRSGAIQAGVKWNALTVDHAEHLGAEELESLRSGQTIVTLLPASALFLGLSYGDQARRLIGASVPLAIASDFNPGSAPGGNMNLVLSLACIQLGMTTPEAVNGATLNGAIAMGLGSTHGTICPGKTASFIITKQIPSLDFLPYSLGRHLLEKVVISGHF